jgi:hypothetical protein
MAIIEDKTKKILKAWSLDKEIKDKELQKDIISALNEAFVMGYNGALEDMKIEVNNLKLQFGV